MPSLNHKKIATREGLLAYLCIMFIFASYSALGVQDTNTALTQSLEHELLSDITYHLPPTNLVYLTLNSKAEENNDTMPLATKIPLVKYPAESPINKGIVLVVSDLQAHGNLDNKLLGLAQSMSKNTWNSIVFTPNIDYIRLFTKNQASSDEKESEPVRDKSGPLDENSSPQTGVKPFEMQSTKKQYAYDDYHRFIYAFLKHAKKELMNNNGYFVVLASGQSAHVISEALIANQELTKNESTDNKPLVDALILHNPYWPEVAKNDLIVKNIANLNIPVLDLVGDQDNHWSKQTRLQRKNAAFVQTKALYRQRNIVNTQSLYTNHQYAAKELRAWLYYLGW